MIVGGGLAGAAAAIALAGAGRCATLIEREPFPRHKVCGEFLSIEAIHFLERLGVNLPLHGAHWVNTVRLASAGHLAATKLPFAALSLTRRNLDALLLRVAERAGATVLRGQAVESLTPAGDVWTAALNTGRTINASKVILATGKHDLRGFPRPQGRQGDLVALKMYFRLNSDETAALRNSVELFLHPHGYTGLQPVEDGAANLTALVRRPHLTDVGGWPGLLAELKATNPHAARRLRNAESLLDKPLALSAIPYGFVRKQALAPMVYAVGDQAAVIPSFTGDGMSIALFTGLRAAQSILAGEGAILFQSGLHRQLRGQVARATTLSRALVHPALKPLLTIAANLWPHGLGYVASLTRLSKSALTELPESLSFRLQPAD